MSKPSKVVKKSNWSSLKKTIHKEDDGNINNIKLNSNDNNKRNANDGDKKRKRTDLKDALNKIKEGEINDSMDKTSIQTTPLGEGVVFNKLSKEVIERYIGLDCEMVGLGPTGKQSALARCCMVDFDGKYLFLSLSLIYYL
jgi:RNA exonuclease 4